MFVRIERTILSAQSSNNYWGFFMKRPLFENTRFQVIRITYFLDNHLKIRAFHVFGAKYRCVSECNKIYMSKNMFLESKSKLPKRVRFIRPPSTAGSRGCFKEWTTGRVQRVPLSCLCSVGFIDCAFRFSLV